MNFQWIAIITGLGFVGLSIMLPKHWRWTWARLLAFLLFSVRFGLLLWSWVHGVYELPVEISTISYFLFSLTMMFRLKLCYDLAAFFSLISGIGFFLFYGIMGVPDFLFTSMSSFVVSAMSHGILLFGGIVLMLRVDFRSLQPSRLWIGLLAILLHGAILLHQGDAEPTFISYLVHLDYLAISSSPLFNIVIRMLFFGLLYVIFQMLIHTFYRINAWYMERTEKQHEAAKYHIVSNHP